MKQDKANITVDIKGVKKDDAGFYELITNGGKSFGELIVTPKPPVFNAAFTGELNSMTLMLVTFDDGDSDVGCRKRIVDAGDQNDQNRCQHLKVATNTFRLQNRHQHQCHLKFLLLTLFIFHFSDLSVGIKDRAVFSCEVADVAVTGVWFRNNKKINESDNIKLGSEGNQRQLIIESVSDQDIGEYEFRNKV